LLLVTFVLNYFFLNKVRDLSVVSSAVMWPRCEPYPSTPSDVKVNGGELSFCVHISYAIVVGAVLNTGIDLQFLTSQSIVDKVETYIFVMLGKYKFVNRFLC
jgi:hypothetical protein